MARYYATFDGSTIAALEANTAGKRFARVPFLFADPATLKQALLDQRAALDAAVRPQIPLAKNDGSLGIVVPRDGMTRGASSSSADLYTNAGAAYNTDPSVRPTSDILVANSTKVAPTTTITVPNSTIDAARAAVTNAVSACGLYQRLGNDGAKTLRSLYAPGDCSYFAWDSFTPEDLDPDPLTGALIAIPGDPTTAPFQMTFGWQIFHPQDLAECESIWTIDVVAIRSIPGQTAGTGVGALHASGTKLVGQGWQGAAATGPTQRLQGGFTYRADCTVQLRYPATGVVGIVNRYHKDFDVLG